MELIVIVAALILLDLLALRFGVDSRVNTSRSNGAWWSSAALGDAPWDAAQAHLADVRSEAHAFGLASLAATTATSSGPSIRLRVADGLRALATRIEPVCYLPTVRA